MSLAKLIKNSIRGGVILIGFSATSMVQAQSVPVDLNTWTAMVQAQSDFNAFNTEVSDKVEVNTASHNDSIGFELGFLPGDSNHTTVPLTILGSLTALGFGGLFKKKLSNRNS